MPPVRNIATGLSAEELRLLREAIERHAPQLLGLLTDTTHDELTLAESDQLVDAVANELTFGEDDALHERGVAFDNLIDRINLGPYMR